MKFEFVEFYQLKQDDKAPRTNKKLKRMIGTLHIYAVDCELDIRGIQVFKYGSSFFFQLPHFRAIDENGNQVRYPHLRWTSSKIHKEMLDFLRLEAKDAIKRILSHQG